MNNQERRMLYEATQALLRIPPAKDDRVKGAIEYSKEIREALGKFNSFVGFMLSDEDPEMAEFLLNQLIEFSERMGTK